MKRSSLAWAWNPPAAVNAALKRGAEKVRGHALGIDKPHFGGIIETKPAEPATRRTTMATKNTNSRKGKGKTVTTTPAKTDGGKIPLKKICADLKMEPRLARRKLRGADLGFHDARDRWNFTPAQVTKVKEILSPAATN